KLVFKLTNVHGALITMPHNVTTLALVDEASVSARIAGACYAERLNARGALIGDMFDGKGLVRGLLSKGRVVKGAARLCRGLGWGRLCDRGFARQGRCFQVQFVRCPSAGHERAVPAADECGTYFAFGLCRRSSRERGNHAVPGRRAGKSLRLPGGHRHAV